MNLKLLNEIQRHALIYWLCMTDQSNCSLLSQKCNIVVDVGAVYDPSNHR